MQTELSAAIKHSTLGQKADEILRSCVHCGFCTATCPTYRLFGDELDGPRGRIYQIKRVLEGNPADEGIRTHLDRCLTCRSCETTCPSGVNYVELLDIGRSLVEQQVPRPWPEKLKRRLISRTIGEPKIFSALLELGRLAKPVLPGPLKQKIPAKIATESWPKRQHARSMLMLPGCVQQSLAPQIDLKLATLLDAQGISLLRPKKATCCGALAHHLTELDRAKMQARQNIDAWWADIEQGAEAIIASSSGCGVHLREYGHLLETDPAYADKAERVATLVRDPIEILPLLDLNRLKIGKTGQKIAFQAPCTLQHGLKLHTQVEALLRQLGLDLLEISDSHQCCGSAGSHSLLQAEIAEKVRERKLECLTADQPEAILTANIGCLHHLAETSPVPVFHWLELIESTK